VGVNCRSLIDAARLYHREMLYYRWAQWSTLRLFLLGFVDIFLVEVFIIVGLPFQLATSLDGASPNSVIARQAMTILLALAGIFYGILGINNIKRETKLLFNNIYHS